MNLDDLIEALQKMRVDLGRGDSPVIFEGFVLDDTDDTEGFFVQGVVDNVQMEVRCEENDEPQGVYLRSSNLDVS